jgi:hypothetical protein
MGHWSSNKYSTNYEDEDGEEANQPTLRPEREEEPTEDDWEPANDDEEEVPQASKEEEEAPAEEVDNITKTILPGFAPMPRNKKRRLNPPSPNMIVEDDDDSSSE